MFYITSLSIQILWNGIPTKMFSPTQGIRQGNPISPYIFVLCIERLAHAILQQGSISAWNPIFLFANGPSLFYLIFVEDLFLFSKANRAAVTMVNKVLQDFCCSFGQVVNKHKSAVYFSKSVQHSEARILSTNLGILMVDDLGRYLGVLILHARMTKATYQDVEK